MITVGSIVFRVDDLELQARFWEAALDYVRAIDRENDFIMLEPSDGNGPNISLDRVRPNAQTSPQIHLDLYTEEQDEEVARLLELGATEVHWDNRPPDADYVILADPEDNRFCVIDTNR